MAPVRLVSQRQLELIVEFAERNRDFALGNPAQPNTPEAKEAWEKLANKLNRINGGYVKTTQKWKKYWNLLKCRSKARAADNRRYQRDGSNKLYPLSDLEVRVVMLLQNRAQAEYVDDKYPLSDVAEMCVETEMSSEAGDHQNGAGEDNEAAEATFNRDDEMPRWVYSLEERRIATEEHIADAVNGLATTNQLVLECMQGMAASHAQLVVLLEKHFNQ